MELGSDWAIKLLARKKSGQIWLGPVLDQLDPPAKSLPLQDNLAQPAQILGQDGVLNFRLKKFLGVGGFKNAKKKMVTLMQRF